MDQEQPKYPGPGLKATPDGAAPEPFYFRDCRPGEPEVDGRLVVWTGRLDQLRTLIYRVLGTYGELVDVLFKLRPEGDSDTTDWLRYLRSEIPAGELIEVMESCDYFLLGHGYNELCLRKSGSDEYLALDDCGVLFLYSPSPAVASLLVELGFSSCAEFPVLFAEGLWRLSLASKETQIDAFVKPLGLREVS